MTSLLSEAQHHIVQVVFSGTPSGYETHETPCSPISSRSRPNRLKDLPEIRDEPFADGYLPSNSNQSSIDNNIFLPPVHVLSGIGPSTTSTPDYGCQAESSASRSELFSASSSRRRTTGMSGNRSHSILVRSTVPGFRLDSIAEGDEPSPFLSSDIGGAESYLNPIGPRTSSLETTSSSGGNYEELPGNVRHEFE